jgi:AraC-like DNA-binding protein
MTPEKTRRILLAELREKLIPWAQHKGMEQFILAQPPVMVPPLARVTYHRGMPLEEIAGQPAQDRLQAWPQSHVLASRSPRLCCVIKGEVDWRIGITQQMAETLGGEAADCDFHVLSMPAGTFFLMPPGVPYSDGRRAHWEREAQSQEEACIFWLQILPYGVFCHYCQSARSVHTGFPAVYVSGPQFGAQVKELLDVLAARERGKPDRVAQAHLVSLLKKVERALTSQRIPQAQFVTALLSTEPIEFAIPPNVSYAVHLACEFISINLHHPIQLPQIAHYAGISATHLNRCFHSEMGRSTMQFVRERRIHTAKALLLASELLVQDIGEMVGYPNQSHFARIFTQMEQCSPLHYRAAARQKRDQK